MDAVCLCGIEKVYTSTNRFVYIVYLVRIVECLLVMQKTQFPSYWLMSKLYVCLTFRRASSLDITTENDVPILINQCRTILHLHLPTQYYSNCCSDELS